MDINTFDDALRAIVALRDMEEGSTVPEIHFGDAMKSIKIHFEGAPYHASLPGGAIRGLWEYQQNLYRGIAHIIYGVDDIRKLSTAQLRYFELNFLVENGSTDISATIDKIIDAISEGITTMDSKDKKITIISIVFLLVVGYSATQIISAYQDVKIAEISAQQSATASQASAEERQATEEARTAQMQIFANVVTENDRLRRFSELNADGTNSIIKYAPELEAITFGQVSFDRAEIDEVKARSPRGVSEARIETAEFRILKLETMGDPGMHRITVSSSQTGDIVVILEESVFTDQQIKQVLEAYRNREPLHMDVSVARVNDTVRNALVVQIGREEDPL